MLSFYTKNVYFSFSNEIYTETDGVAMFHLCGLW